MQYIELFKQPDNDDDGDNIVDDDEFMYASDYLGDPYDYQDDDSSYTSSTTSSTTTTWSDDSFCREVLDDILFDNDTSSSSSSTFSSSTPSFTGGFFKDTVGRHGTRTAGIAVGTISEHVDFPAEDCDSDEVPGCVGGCVTSDIETLTQNGFFDLDAFCPMYDCDGNGASCPDCLGDNPAETLRQHGGIAPGAKLSVFDTSYTGIDNLISLAGNLVWESAKATGARIHSNSWGAATLCQLTEEEYLYDTFMYEVRGSSPAVGWTRTNMANTECLYLVGRQTPRTLKV